MLRQLVSKVQHIDLAGALAHEALEAFNGIGGLNVPVHRLRKGVKREEVLFILRQTAHGFRIAQRILGFEGGQAGQRLRLGRLIPDADEFGLHVTSLSSRDRTEHVTLLMEQTALTRRGRKQFRDCCQQPIVSISHQQINVCRPS